MPVLLTIIAGAAGAASMSSLMTLVHRSKWANADMIRALGSYATRRSEGAVGWGVVIHFAAGVVFAFVYAGAMSLTNVHSVGGLSAVGGLIGLVHGFAMSFVLLAVVSETHPLPEFRDAGFDVGLAHIVGHIAYGIVVGALVGLLGIDYGLGS